MATAAAQYKLKLQSILDAGQLELELRKHLGRLKAKGITDIKIKTVMDNGQLVRATTQYKNLAGEAESSTLKWGRSLSGSLNPELKNTTRVTSGATKGTNFFTKAIGDAAITAIKYSLGLGLIYKAMAQIGDGVQYIKDLDKEMRNIQIVTGYTDETISSLADNYNELAKAMGATTLEVAQGSLEWTRQGKTIEETQELLRSTLMLSKLGNVETAQATEYLTSILNGFKLEASDTEDVVSKLVAVDNAAATSVKELSVALQKGSVSAQKAGVDLDELIAYVGTVSSVTRQSAERIGTAFRTMFARFQDIKSGALDDTEDSLNNVEAALRRVEAATGKSIPIVNRQTGEFRDFSDVLEDLYSVWDDLNEIEQANISKALAGVRQREVLLALMENEEMMRNLLAEAMDSEGLAADRYAIYLEGLEAAQNKARASWEGLWKTTIENDLIVTFYDATAAILDFIEGLGGLDTVLYAAVTALVAFNTSLLLSSGAGFLSFIGVMMGEIGALIALLASGTPIAATFSAALAGATWPFALLAIVIGGLVLTIGNLNKIVKESKQAVEDAWVKYMDGVAEATGDATAVVDAYGKKLEELGEIYENLPWYMKLFISEQKRVEEGLGATLSAIEQSADTWEEYSDAIESVAEMAGYTVDENGKLYRIVQSSHGPIRYYGDGFESLSKAMYAAGEAASFDKAKFESLDNVVKEANARILEFTESFQKFIGAAYDAKEDTGINELFENILTNLSNSNRQFQQGTIDIETYFDQLEASLEDVDMTEMFGGDTDSAELFFTGLTQNAAEAIAAISNDFADGEISVTQYTEQLSELGDVFIRIGQLSEYFLGANNIVTEAIGGISEGISELRQGAEANIVVQETMRQITQENLRQGTEDFNKQIDLVARTMAASGIVYRDTQNKVIQGADNLRTYMMNTTGGFQQLADQTANATGISIGKVVTAAGKMLVVLGNAIGSFDAEIKFSPKVMGPPVDVVGGFWGNILPGLPTFGYDINASSQGMGDIGAAISALGESMISSGADINLDASIYTQGFDTAQEEFKALGDTLGSITNAFQDVAGASKKAAKQATKDAKSVNKLLDVVVAKIKQEAKARKDSLKEQLAGYKKLIKTRKDLLDTMQDEEKYQKKLASKQRGLTRIQSEIEELRLDDSEEAAARRRALEEEAAEMQDEIAEDQADRGVELQKDALDEEYEAFKENIEAQIDLIDEYLSEPGRIVADALSLIEGKGKNLYASLIEWNSIYGTGIKTDIVSAWDDAYKAISKYGDALSGLSGGTGSIPSYHTGGIVGGSYGGSGEVVAKLLTGELVSTRADMDNFISRILPSMLGAAVELSGGAGVTVDTFMELNVAGNLDSSVVPQIDKIAMRAVEKMTEIMQSRGHVRRAQQFQI